MANAAVMIQEVNSVVGCCGCCNYEVTVKTWWMLQLFSDSEYMVDVAIVKL